jgi:hypothetical protein
MCGSLGVIRTITLHLAGFDDWEVVSISARLNEFPNCTQFIVLEQRAASLERIVLFQGTKE